MIPLSEELIEYKERTLEQLFINRDELQELLSQEPPPSNPRTLQSRLEDVEAHIGRLEDELAGVVVDEPVVQELFVQAAKALAKEKFHLARRYVNKLETIEPFHPALERLKEEIESSRVSRRTKSIAQGTAVAYPGMEIPLALPAPSSNGLALSAAETAYFEEDDDGPKGFAKFFQFHIMASCLVVVLLACMMFGTGGVTVLRWLIEGS